MQNVITRSSTEDEYRAMALIDLQDDVDKISDV